MTTKSDALPAVPLHRFVRPFLLENTKDWRERKRISQMLEDIKQSCEEVEAFTDKSGSTYNIAEADDSMRTLEKLALELFAETCRECKGTGRDAPHADRWCDACAGEGHIVSNSDSATKKS